MKKKISEFDQSENPAFDIYLGTNRSGKSAAAAMASSGLPRLKVFSNNWPKVKGSSAEVFVPKPEVKDNENLLIDEFLKSVDTCFIIDDLRQWFGGQSSFSNRLTFLFSERRVRNNDLILITHGFKGLPTDLLDYSPRFVVFLFSGTVPERFFADAKEKRQDFLKVVDSVQKQCVKKPYSFDFYIP